MNEVFDDKSEKLYRAIFPENKRPDFWKRNGKPSSAAFKDRRGLSVDRAGGRKNKDCVQRMSERFQGRIVSVDVESCTSAECYLKYCPSENNIFHTEIHGSKDRVLLDEIQAFKLANSAHMEK